MDALRLLPPRVRTRVKDFFTYNIVFNTLAASATSTNSANIQGDSDFWLIATSMIVTNAAGTSFTSPASVPVTIELSDTASGRTLQDSASALSSVFGTAQLPFYLPFPREFKAGGQLQAKLQNQDSGNAYLVRLSFHGFKVYNGFELSAADVAAQAQGGGRR